MITASVDKDGYAIIKDKARTIQKYTAYFDVAFKLISLRIKYESMYYECKLHRDIREAELQEGKNSAILHRDRISIIGGDGYLISLDEAFDPDEDDMCIVYDAEPDAFTRSKSKIVSDMKKDIEDQTSDDMGTGVRIPQEILGEIYSCRLLHFSKQR
jgi:hypothetical protein